MMSETRAIWNKFDEQLKHFEAKVLCLWKMKPRSLDGCFPRKEVISCDCLQYSTKRP